MRTRLLPHFMREVVIKKVWASSPAALFCLLVDLSVANEANRVAAHRRIIKQRLVSGLYKAIEAEHRQMVLGTDERNTSRGGFSNEAVQQRDFLSLSTLSSMYSLATNHGLLFHEVSEHTRGRVGGCVGVWMDVHFASSLPLFALRVVAVAVGGVCIMAWLMHVGLRVCDPTTSHRIVSHCSP